MSNFFNAMTRNDSYTANGAVTHSTSSSACLDLFFLIGASRGQDMSNVIAKAYSENPELTARIMLWARDIRQGAGERQHMKTFLAYLEDTNQIELALKVIQVLPELGRWDDILEVKHERLKQMVSVMVHKAIWKNRDGLCAKWMPRENGAKRHIAKWLMEYLGVTPRQYRKAIVQCTKVIETNLCNKDYSFNYSHVPSQAMKKYIKAFYRNDQERFEAYKQALMKGTEGVKINAGAIYPNEVLAMMYNDNQIALQMWKALPNFLDKESGSILPVCDVSGSMGSWEFGNKANSPIMVSMALGLYIAQRNEGPFKNMLMTFCGRPKMCKVSSLEATSSLYAECHNIYAHAPDMSTNVQAVFDLLLSNLISGKVSVEEMPKTLLIISDMEFNSCGYGTNFDLIDNKYRQAGFPRPNIVFWNVYGRPDNCPVEMDTNGTAMVSGYSPSIIKSVLGNKMNPMQIMLDTVMVDRYDFKTNATSNSTIS